MAQKGTEKSLRLLRDGRMVHKENIVRIGIVREMEEPLVGTGGISGRG